MMIIREAFSSRFSRNSQIMKIRGSFRITQAKWTHGRIQRYARKISSMSFTNLQVGMRQRIKRERNERESRKVNDKN